MPISETHNQDCLEAMRGMADKCFDLALVDCPYGIGEDGSKNHSRTKLAIARNYKAYSGNDKEPPPPEFFNQLFRISKKQIIWGANHFIERIGKNSPCWIVWDKQNGTSDFADCELAWTSFNSAVRKFDFRWAGMLQGNMQKKEVRIHPNQKPIALYHFLLTNYAQPGDRILDTHLGSGSSRIAAYDLGFDFVGYELDRDYWLAQEERFQRHIAQPKLFEPAQVTTQEALF